MNVAELEKLVLDPAVAGALLKIARVRTRDPHAAEDLVQETTVRAWQRQRGDDPWRGPPPPLIQWMGSILNGVRANEWRKGQRRPQIVEGDGTEVEVAGTRPDEEERERDAEDAAAQARERVKEGLRAFFERQGEKGRVPCGVLRAAEEGIRGADAVARAIGCEVEEVYRATERIQRRLKRMRELGDAAPVEEEAAS